MYRKNFVPLLLLIAVGACSQSRNTPASTVPALPESVVQCDRLASHPSDPSKPREIAGILDDRKIDAAAAFRVCAQAIREANIPRLRFQYGRAILRYKNYRAASNEFRVAARRGHKLAKQYLEQTSRVAAATTPRTAANTPRQRRNPHENFERQMTGAAAFLGALAAAALAERALDSDQPARPLPPGSTPDQCREVVSSRALYCAQEPEYTSTGASYTYRCNSKWRSENRACLPTFNTATPHGGGRPYFCDPVTKTLYKNTREELVSQVCG